MFVPTLESRDRAELHFIVNGEDRGVQATDIPYKGDDLLLSA